MAEYSRSKIDTIRQEIDMKLDALVSAVHVANVECAIREAERAVEVSSADAEPPALTRTHSFSGASVAMKKAVKEMLPPIGDAAKFMEGILLAGVKSRPQLLEVFGDCTLVSHFQAVVEQVQSLLGQSLMGEQRLARALDKCKSIKDVLKDIDAGLERVLRQRLQEETEALEKIMLPPVRESPPPCPELSARLLLDLDASECAFESRQILEELFSMYAKDTPGDGELLITGDRYNEVVGRLVDHVIMEATERNARKGTTVPNADLVKKWVTYTVDPNGDGAITKQEAMAGFAKVVDDVESGADYIRKRSSLTSKSDGACSDVHSVADVDPDAAGRASLIRADAYQLGA